MSGGDTSPLDLPALDLPPGDDETVTPIADDAPTPLAPLSTAADDEPVGELVSDDDPQLPALPEPLGTEELRITLPWRGTATVRTLGRDLPYTCVLHRAGSRLSLPDLPPERDAEILVRVHGLDVYVTVDIVAGEPHLELGRDALASRVLIDCASPR